MPSKKQRRRREKTFRHEYETVLLDAEGNEVEVDPDELRAEREEKRAAKAKPASKGKQASRGGRPQRVPPPPTWERALKRGALMGGVMLFAFVFIFKDAPLPLRIGWGLLYGAAFVPLTYFIDRTAHRTYLKRQARKAS
jgi:hypothetical protein